MKTLTCSCDIMINLCTPEHGRDERGKDSVVIACCRDLERKREREREREREKREKRVK